MIEPREGGDAGAGAALDEPPPLLGSWGRIYIVVLVLLAADILAFGFLTWWAS
jgi:hypothetical protein